MLPPFEPPPVQAGVLNSPIQPLDIGTAFGNAVPDFSTKFYTTVIVKSTKDHPVLPHNATLGTIQPFTPNHDKIFSEAADHTAATLADTWSEYARHTGKAQTSPSAARSQAQPFGTSPPPKSWSLHAQTSEMAKAGLDSSYLSPFLPEPDLDPPHVYPLVEIVDLDPHSEEYFQKLVAASDLDTDSYAHVDPTTMTKFKELIRKYPHAFYLPGTSLNTIKGFHHNIHTGDSPPGYRLLYRKSPHELAAIKDELQKMLKLHIIWPSFSTWGAPCILVCKPLEKGLPRPPRFVVDCRGLNTVTSGDGYPIPSVSNVLDALSGGKTFAKLDLASGYWRVLVNPDHVHKTAFATHLGLYEFTCMPYDLKPTPQTFQRILNSVFADFLYQWLIIYINDVIVWANTDFDALSHYELVSECAAKFGIQFKPSKCAFFSQDLEILGHHVTLLGWFPTSKGTEAISAMPIFVTVFATWLLAQNIFVLFCVKAPLLCGLMLMK